MLAVAILLALGQYPAPMSNKQYQAADIEVLSGLEPVRRRPGMYTDTARPNHLVQEVVDNSRWTLDAANGVLEGTKETVHATCE